MTRYALISVTDKSGLPALARAFCDRGYTLLSTGGTASYLRLEGLEVMDVATVTGVPELFGGRVKTLNHMLFGGILAPVADLEQLRELGWPRIDAVVVNLYDFAGTTRKPGVTLAELIEKIDIGGPSLLRAAAKNWERVAAVCDMGDYATVIDALRNGDIGRELRYRLARKVFCSTMEYDQQIVAGLPARLPQQA